MNNRGKLKELKNKLNIYYARAMDEISVSEILFEDRVVKGALEDKGFILINPFNEYDSSNSSVNIIVKQNEEVLKNSDILLVNLSKVEYVYIGAIFEIFQAYNFNIPIVIYIGDSKLHKRIYIQFYCDFICKNLEEALEYIWCTWTIDGVQHQLSEEISYYDGISKSYDIKGRKTYLNKRKDNKNKYDLERSFLKQSLIDFCKNKNVLELGCGNGDYSCSIVKSAKSLTCIEISEDMINEAKKKANEYNLKPTFILGDFLDDEVISDKYDIIISYFALSFLPPHLQNILVRNMQKWLKQNGKVLIAESIQFSTLPSTGLGKIRIQKRNTNTKEHKIYKEHFTHFSLKELFEVNQFNVSNINLENIWFAFCVATK